MLTGVAINPTSLAWLRGLPYGWEFVVAVILLILLFYIRVHRPRNGSRQKTGHRSGRRTARHASSVPERGGNHGHSAVSRRQPHRP
jgi:hypothetical protein